MKTGHCALVFGCLAGIAGLVCLATGGLTGGDFPNVPGVLALATMYLCGVIAAILTFAAILFRVLDNLHRRSGRQPPRSAAPEPQQQGYLKPK